MICMSLTLSDEDNKIKDAYDNIANQANGAYTSNSIYHCYCDDSAKIYFV